MISELSRNKSALEVKDEYKSSTIGYFFLLVYTFGVLVRPQDIIVGLTGVPVIMVVTILSFVFAVFLSKDKKWSPHQTFLLLIIPFIMLSAFFNGWGTKGIADSISMLITSIIPLFLYVSLIDSISRTHRIMIISIFASLVMIHNGWIQQNSLDGYGWTGTQSVGGESKRIVYVGIFGDPNDLGMLIVMNFPFVLYFYNRGLLLTKIICLLISTIFIYGILITGSRGTLLGLIGVVGLYMLFKYGGAKLIVAGLLAGPVLATLITQRGGLSSEDASARGRLYAWYDGIQYLLSNPFLGIGKNNFVDMHGLTAHNSYILVAAELGAIVYTLWGGALALTVFLGYKVFKLPRLQFTNHEFKDRINSEILLSNALFFSMIGFLLTSFFLSRSYTLLLYIFLGLNVSVHYRLITLIPSLRDYFNYKSALKAGIASWIMLILVYLTVKVTL